MGGMAGLKWLTAVTRLETYARTSGSTVVEVEVTHSSRVPSMVVSGEDDLYSRESLIDKTRSDFRVALADQKVPSASVGQLI